MRIGLFMGVRIAKLADGVRSMFCSQGMKSALLMILPAVIRCCSTRLLVEDGELVVSCFDSLGRLSYGGCEPARIIDVKYSLMITCLGDVVRPRIGQATVRLLRRLGHEVDFPPTQTCCGQPMFNSGFSDMARQQAQHTIRVFEGEQAVVTPSGSCAAMIKSEYPHLFEGDSEWHPRAVDLAERTFELSDLLVNQLEVTDVGAQFAGKVTYHFACHLRMLEQTDEVVQLIEGIDGAEYIPLNHQDQCCGFGGSFSVRYPQVSGSMVDDKAECILATGADVVVSTDAGCLMNIGGRLHRAEKTIEVLHIAELLDRTEPQ
jgi:L-lactate dehydrogenase complex protein LldE